MAERRGAGLTFGQLITLTFGFLLASVVIFVFGLWVGRDLAEQRGARRTEDARVPIAAAPTPAPAAVVLAPTAPVVLPPTALPTLTAMRRLPTTTAVPPRATPTRRAAVSPTVAGGAWTVQAYATNDTMRAIMLARTLKSKGYDAATATKQVGGVTWYTVRVGRFGDRVAAKAMENKLRAEEGLEAASVVPVR